MSKDPAFLFYPNDWLGGTILFSRLHKGAYMDILMAQFNHGHMDIEDVKNLLGEDFEKVWPKLKTKLVQDEKGLYYNERLDAEVNKRKAYTDSRRRNLEKKPPPPKKNKDKKDDDMDSHMETHMGSHMENEDENRDINKDRDKGGVGEEEEKKPKSEPVPKVFDFKESLIEAGGNAELVDGYMKVRKKKGGVNSEIALNLFLKEAGKTKLKLNEVLETCIKRNWLGFEADWITNNTNTNGKLKRTDPEVSKQMGYDIPL